MNTANNNILVSNGSGYSVFRKLVLAIVVCAFATLLHILYVDYISGPFSYIGYRFFARNIGIWPFGFAVTLIPVAFMPDSFERPSSYLVWIQYMISVVPFGVLSYSVVRLEPEIILFANFILVLAFCSSLWGTRARLLNIPPLAIPRPLKYWTIFIISIIMMLVTIREFGFKIQIVSLLDVYEIRDQFKAQAESGSRLSTYMISWQGNVMYPMLFGLALARRNLVLLGLALFGEVIIFSITGFKSMAFSMVLVAAVVLLLRKKEYAPFFMAGGSFVILSISWILFEFYDYNLFGYVFARRLFVVPGILGSYYMDYFLSHPKLMLSHGMFSMFFEGGAESPASIIGKNYFRFASPNSNAGIWADAYANFGIIGLFVYAQIFALCLRLFDGVGQMVDSRLSFAAICVVGFSMTNSALTTSMLTHGGLFAVAMLILLNEPQENGR